jgi:ABC-type transport system substrate-binding protein
MRLRLALAVLMATTGAALLALAAEVKAARSGGTFVVVTREEAPDELDPALAYTPLTWELLGASCTFLLGRRQVDPPAGYRPVPEAAEAFPRISRNGTRYTFTIRRGLRFADGTPLTARNYAHAIGRLRDPRLESPLTPLVREVVSARTVGPRTLVITLSGPVPDLPARLAMPVFCPVPLGVPADPEGLRAPFSGGGPYYVSRWERGRELVLERNRYYRGPRPRHVDRFLVRYESDPNAALDQVRRGQADWLVVSQPFIALNDAALRRQYGINRSQYHLRAAPIIWYLVLNAERPLFRNNARLRRAINFAVDRKAMASAFVPGFRNATDQLLPPSVPGFRNAVIYPLKRPNLARARALARGQTRGGKAVMYAWSPPPLVAVAQAVRANLRQIGIDVEIKVFPPNEAGKRMGTRGEPFDIGLWGWGADYIDPYNFLAPALDGRGIRASDNVNLSYFHSAKFNRELDRAQRLTGDARLRALGDLDIRTMRDEAPVVVLYHQNAPVLVSERAGCLVFNGYAAGLNLGAVCLR